MKAKLVQVKKIQFPALRVSKDTLEDCGELAKASIVDNIKQQTKVDGGPLKSNQPQTREYKRSKGWTVGGSVYSLVAKEHRFTTLRNWIVRTSKGGRQYVEIRPRAARSFKKIVGYVQAKGYVGWFDVSNKGMKAIRFRLRKWVKEEFRKARRR